MKHIIAAMAFAGTTLADYHIETSQIDYHFMVY